MCELVLIFEFDSFCGVGLYSRQGINDRVALGGGRVMASYFLRYYGLHDKLWVPGLDDYNHLWAEPDLAALLFNHTNGREHDVWVLRTPQLFNYSEQLEVPIPTVYVGDDAT